MFFVWVLQTSELIIVFYVSRADTHLLAWGHHKAVSLLLTGLHFLIWLSGYDPFAPFWLWCHTHQTKSRKKNYIILQINGRTTNENTLSNLIKVPHWMWLHTLMKRTCLQSDLAVCPCSWAIYHLLLFWMLEDHICLTACLDLCIAF